LLKKEKTPEPVEREDGLTDYDVYIMSKGERLMYIVLAACALFAVGYIFYHNVILSAILAVFSLKFPKMRTRQIIEKRKQDLTVQFKDMLYALSAALSAGRSVEMGLKSALTDLRILYPNDDDYIIKELGYIVRGIEMNETVEDMFRQFAERAHIEDVENFIDVFVTCKRTGGDIIQVIRSTSQTIGEKIEIKQEIATMISGKKFEFKVLMVMPIALIFLLSVASADYMTLVFEDVRGNIAMTVAILLFAAAYAVGTRIMKIEV
jgi:tight adherence protein B